MYSLFHSFLAMRFTAARPKSAFGGTCSCTLLGPFGSQAAATFPSTVTTSRQNVLNSCVMHPPSSECEVRCNLREGTVVDGDRSVQLHVSFLGQLDDYWQLGLLPVVVLHNDRVFVVLRNINLSLKLWINCVSSRAGVYCPSYLDNFLLIARLNLRRRANDLGQRLYRNLNTSRIHSDT